MWNIFGFNFPNFLINLFKYDILMLSTLHFCKPSLFLLFNLFPASSGLWPLSNSSPAPPLMSSAPPLSESLVPPLWRFFLLLELHLWIFNTLFFFDFPPLFFSIFLFITQKQILVKDWTLSHRKTVKLFNKWELTRSSVLTFNLLVHPHFGLYVELKHLFIKHTKMGRWDMNLFIKVNAKVNESKLLPI